MESPAPPCAIIKRLTRLVRPRRLENLPRHNLLKELERD